MFAHLPFAQRRGALVVALAAVAHCGLVRERDNG
jgi:hypothetical protein